jgi:RHS repeat-associated protein
LIVSRCVQLFVGLCLGLMSALAIAQTPADIFKKIQPAITYLLEGETVEIYNLYADHLDTPRLITNQAGQAVWKWDNDDPFGNNAPNENPSALAAFAFDLGFPGQVRNRETGTFYNGFRDCYDPATGRYCQSDPIGLAGGINTYAYVDSNPLSRSDPSGLFFTPDTLLDIGFIGYDLYRIGADNIFGNAENLLENLVSLGANLAGLCLPGVTGLGATTRVTRGRQAAKPTLQTPERIVLDSRGNAIPLNRGEYLTRSPDGRWVQVRDASGRPTGMRIDGPHNPRTHSDPRSLQPHAHVPGVTNLDGTPWLPIK